MPAAAWRRFYAACGLHRHAQRGEAGGDLLEDRIQVGRARRVEEVDAGLVCRAGDVLQERLGMRVSGQAVGDDVNLDTLGLDVLGQLAGPVVEVVLPGDAA